MKRTEWNFERLEIKEIGDIGTIAIAHYSRTFQNLSNEVVTQDFNVTGHGVTEKSAMRDLTKKLIEFKL